MAQSGKQRFLRHILRINSFWLSLGLTLMFVFSYVLSRPEIEILPVPTLLELIEA